MNITDESTLSQLFQARIRATPNAAAFRQFDGTTWRSWTWQEIGAEWERWRAALARESLARGDRVALCLRNGVEWVLVDQAALSLDLVSVPLHVDDHADNMAWCLSDAGARILFLHSAAQWTPLRDKAAQIKKVVCLQAAESDDPRVVLLSDWLATQAPPPAQSSARAQDLATIVYTSGTTGRPKGVMLSHRNILSNVIATLRGTPAGPDDRFLSFLPLAHVFERSCGYYAAVMAGSETVYARSIALLADDLREQRPTVVMAVPRIFERIWAAMSAAMPPGSAKRSLFDQAVAVGWRRFCGQARPLDRWVWPVLWFLVARKLHARLGGRLRIISAGGAPLSDMLARVFVGLGVPLYSGYGLTETSPVLSANTPGDNNPLTVGRALAGVQLRCDAHGEILAKGPNVMLGYWNNPQASAAAIDDDGWFHTGDLGKIENGYLTVTGRIKDIIVLSTGEKISPTDVEAAILRDPVFQQVMVVGEGRARLGLLCVSEQDDLTELHRRAVAQLEAFPAYARLSHVARVGEAWTVDNGLLTPTLKIRRREIEQRYAQQIETMYATRF